MSGILVVVLVFFALAGGLGAVAYFTYQKKLRRAKAIERGLKMVPILIHLPPPSSDTQGGTRDLREVMREKTAQAEVLYNLIAGTATEGFKSNFYGQRHIAFELIVVDGLVHFYAAVPVALVSVVKKAVQTAYPGARLEEVEDHNIFNQEGRLAATLGGEMVLRAESGYPIATYDQLERDPMEAILTTVSALEKQDGVAIQIMLRPAGDSWRKKAVSLADAMRKGKHGQGSFTAMDLAKAAMKAPAERREDDRVKNGGSPDVSKLQLSQVERIEEKTKHPGFEVLVRVIVSTGSTVRSQQLLRDISTAFALFENPGLNGFKFLPALDVQGLVTAFIFRFFPNELSSNVLNSAELATLFHLPDSQFTPSASGQRQQTKQVDGPVALSGAGLLFGYNEFRGVKKEIRLGEEDRRRHTYILGQTGTGKSTMLENLAVQDMLAGNGFAFIDPHGDSAEKLLALVPKERAEDVIYFNPADTQYPLGLNLFEFTDPAQKDFLVQETINMLYKLYDPGHTGIIGPRYEHWYRNAALTLMADPGGSTFIEIPKVFTDTDYLKKKFKYLKDPTVIDFWTKEMGQTSDYHKSEMLGWFVSKFGAFQNNEMMRNIIGQTKSSFNIREIMDQKKILIVNLSKGRIGELNSQLLGMIFVIKFQAAAMSRADVPENERADFALYVDEFQNFSTDSFASILSEARKYRLNLIVANQFIGQLSNEIRDAVFGNIGTIVAHRMGPDDAEFMVKQFAPVFDASDLVNIPNYQAAMRLMIGGLPSQPFSIADSAPLGTPNAELGMAIKQLSAAKYGHDKAVVEADLVARLNATPPAAAAAVVPAKETEVAAVVTPIAPAVAPVSAISPAAVIASGAVPPAAAITPPQVVSVAGPAMMASTPPQVAPGPPPMAPSPLPLPSTPAPLPEPMRAVDAVAAVALGSGPAMPARPPVVAAAAVLPTATLATAPPPIGAPPIGVTPRLAEAPAAVAADSAEPIPATPAAAPMSPSADAALVMAPPPIGAPPVDLPGPGVPAAPSPAASDGSSQLTQQLAAASPAISIAPAPEGAVPTSAPAPLAPPPIGAAPIDIPGLPRLPQASSGPGTLSLSDITGGKPAAARSEPSPYDDIPLLAAPVPTQTYTSDGRPLENDPYAQIDVLGEAAPLADDEPLAPVTEQIPAVPAPQVGEGRPMDNDPYAEIDVLGPGPGRANDIAGNVEPIAPVQDYLEPAVSLPEPVVPELTARPEIVVESPVPDWSNSPEPLQPMTVEQPPAVVAPALPDPVPEPLAPVFQIPAPLPPAPVARPVEPLIHFVDPAAEQLLNSPDKPAESPSSNTQSVVEGRPSLDGLPAGVQLLDQSLVKIIDPPTPPVVPAEPPAPQPVEPVVPVIAPPVPVVAPSPAALMTPEPVVATSAALESAAAPAVAPAPVPNTAVEVLKTPDAVAPMEQPAESEPKTAADPASENLDFLVSVVDALPEAMLPPAAQTGGTAGGTGSDGAATEESVVNKQPFVDPGVPAVPATPAEPANPLIEPVQTLQPPVSPEPPAVAPGAPEPTIAPPAVPEPEPAIEAPQPAASEAHLSGAESIEKAEHEIDDLLSVSLIHSDSTPGHHRLPEPVEASAAPQVPSGESSELDSALVSHGEGLAEGAGGHATMHHSLKVIRPLGPIVPLKQRFAAELAELNAKPAEAPAAAILTIPTPLPPIPAIAAPAPLAQTVLPPSKSLVPVPPKPTSPEVAMAEAPPEKPAAAAAPTPTIVKHSEPMAMSPAPLPVQAAVAAPVAFEPDEGMPVAESLDAVEVAKTRDQAAQAEKPLEETKPQPPAEPFAKPTRSLRRRHRANKRSDKPVEVVASQAEADHNKPSAAAVEAAPLTGKLILPTGEKPVAKPDLIRDEKPKELAPGEVYVDASGNVIIGE